MAHNRRQQRPQRQFQRSPGSFGPPPKRPRTAPPLPPLPPMEWEYDHGGYERSPRGSRYPPPMYDDYERMPEYAAQRAPRRDFAFHGADNDFYGEYRRGPPRRQQQQQPQPQHQKPFRQDRQQYPYRPQQQQQQQVRGGRSQRGGPPIPMDQWNDGRRRQRNQKGGQGGGMRGNGGRKSPGRFDDKESSMDRNGMGLQRNWTKTYWAGKGDSPTKRAEEKRQPVEIPEETRFYILCSVIKSKFRVGGGLCETFDYFLKEGVAKLTPAFTFKRADGRTHCRFYLGDVCVAQGSALTRSDAKRAACEAAAATMETQTPEAILATHEHADMSKLAEGEEVDAIDYSLLSHLERFTGEKPLNNFVILQTEVWSTDDTKANWTSVLVQSAVFSRMELHFQLKGQDHKRVICNIHIDGKFIFSGRGRLVKEAKNFAAKGAVAKLDKTCYTLMIKEGTKNDDHKNLEEVMILDSTGKLCEGISEEEFKVNVTDFLKKYVEEEDVTKPLVLSTEGMSKEEREIIIEIAKSLQLSQRNEKLKKDEVLMNKKAEEKKVEKKLADENAEKKLEEKKPEEEEKKETTDVEKGEEKEEDDEKEEDTEKEEDKKVNDESAEPKQDEEDEKKDDESTEVKDGAAATEEKENETEKTEEKEDEAAKTEEKEEEEEEEEEKKDVRPIVLVRKYSGIDVLDYVLNHDGETWKYKAVSPGTRQREAEAEAAAVAAAEAEAKAKAAEENAAKEGEATEEAVDDNHTDGAKDNSDGAGGDAEAAEEEMDEAKEEADEAEEEGAEEDDDDDDAAVDEGVAE